MQDSNTATVEIVQESTTPDNASQSTSQQDKLAGTGEINMIVINALNESSDFSHVGSRSSSCETQKFMTVIEENTEMTENDQKSSLSQDLTARIKEASRRSAEEEDSSEESDDETIDKIEVEEEVDDKEDEGNTKEFGDMKEYKSEDENEGNTEVGDKMIEEEVMPLQIDDNSEDNFDDDEGENEDIKRTVENFGEIQELIEEEIDYFDNMEKSVEEELAGKEASIREEVEKSLSEGKVHRSAEFKVLDRNSAPKVMLEYEPSTTEAESGMSDSDTLETESLQEDFVTMVKAKKGKKKSLAGNQGTGSLSSDKEVARAMGSDSQSSRQIVATQDDFHRGSTEPITQDTMGDGESLVDEEGSEVIKCGVFHTSHMLSFPNY